MSSPLETTLSKEEIKKIIAKRIAKEVQQTHIKVDLDPMPSDERRIIHNTLSRYNNIKTESEGSGNKRHISISYVE